MLKKFGLQSSSNKDLDPPPRLSSSNIHPSSSSSSASTSPNRTTTNNNINNPFQDKEKKKPKRPLRTTPSSDSLAPRPHLPSTVYEPNPFPLDPTQPDGISRFNAFTAKEKHTRKEVREMEVVDIDIEVEETKGFVSGKSRQSVELDHRGVRSEYSRREVDVETEEREYEVSRKGSLYSNQTAISKLSAGLKGALMAKTGLGKGQDKDKERAGTKETTATANKPEEVDAVLQHHLQIQKQQQELHIRQQEQHYQQQQRYTQEQDVVSSSRGQRGRPRERERTRSGPIHHQGRSGHNVGKGLRIRGDEDDLSSPSSYHKDNREPFTDRRTRLHSLSPPPAPGQEHRGSAAYWPDGREGSHPDDQEQMSPFLPQTSSSHHHQQYYSRSQHQQQQYEKSRPLSQASDSDNNGDYSRHARDGRRHSRDRNNEADRDRMRRDAGQRRQSGLYQVTNAASYDRTSSELGEEERLSAAARDDRHRSPQRPVPDRLSRAKEWVASHSKNNSIAAPAPVMDREAALASLPGVFPSRTPHRRSMDSFDDYSVITPPRGSYFVNAGRGSGGYDPRERIVMVDQIRMQELQRSGYRNSMSMVEGDDGRGQYWNRQLEGYEQRDRYRQSRAEYEYETSGGGHGGPYYGYAPGGPDDPDLYDETESTLAPGSAVGGVAKGKAGLEKQTDASKKVGLDGRSSLQPTATAGEEESQELQAKAPNKRRLILRLISLSSSLLVLILLIAASPVSFTL
jgi:hypothetical protein